MKKVKSSLKQLIPPIFVKLWGSKTNRSNEVVWESNFNTWEEAAAKCSGYDATTILEKCSDALSKVRDGEAVYERDSYLFDEIQYSWGLLTGLLHAATLNNNKLCVLDFGGSLGTTYYQNRKLLEHLEVEWCIIEQENFIDRGKKEFENDSLKFYYTVEECMEHHQPNVLLLSSVLQYLENATTWIEKLISFEIPNIIIDRTGFTTNETDLICVQKVPAHIYEASYPCHFFARKKFINHFLKSYTLLGHFNSGFDMPTKINDINVYWDGLILTK